MKRCSTCQRTYPDDAPEFCTADGTRLVKEEAEAYDPQKTMLASAPPPQYANPSAPPPPPSGIPQPAPPPHAPQQGWPPPPPPQQQGQNWGGGYYPGQAYAPPATQGNGLSMAALIVGAVSGALGLFLLLDYLGAIRMLTRDSAYAMIIASVVTGITALVLGIIALISKRQRSKGLAAVGIILGLFSIGFWIYLEVEYGMLF